MGASIVKQMQAAFVSADRRNGRRMERSVTAGMKPQVLTDPKSRREL